IESGRASNARDNHDPAAYDALRTPWTIGLVCAIAGAASAALGATLLATGPGDTNASRSTASAWIGAGAGGVLLTRSWWCPCELPELRRREARRRSRSSVLPSRAVSARARRCCRGARAVAAGSAAARAAARMGATRAAREGPAGREASGREAVGARQDRRSAAAAGAQAQAGGSRVRGAAAVVRPASGDVPAPAAAVVRPAPWAEAVGPAARRARPASGDAP